MMDKSEATRQYLEWCNSGNSEKSGYKMPEYIQALLPFLDWTEIAATCGVHIPHRLANPDPQAVTDMLSGLRGYTQRIQWEEDQPEVPPAIKWLMQSYEGLFIEDE